MWLSEWRAICARISGLHKAAAFTAAMLPDHKRDYASGTAITLIGHANRIGESLMSFLDQFGPALPDQARNSLKHFCLNRQKGKFFADTTARPPATELLPAIALLLSFQAEFEYLVSDSEYLTKTLVGRAFVHLQSSIAADRKVRQSWIEAFNRGEPACERLGASHLLLHGVWSFKASAEHARTDLVLSDPRTDWDAPRRAAQGLVLTEWKRVAAPDETNKKADEAFKQAKLYSEEPLAGFEVASVRYLVLVSKKRLLPMPEARVSSNVAYEYRNVAVDPDSPSIEARKAEDRRTVNAERT